MRGQLCPYQIAACEDLKSSVYILLKMSFNCVVSKKKFLTSEDTKIFPMSFLFFHVFAFIDWKVEMYS